MPHFAINGARHIEFDAEKQQIKITLPIQFGKTSGHSEIFTPDGQPLLMESHKHPCPELREHLVRSHVWHDLLRLGKVKTVKELAKRDKINNKSMPSFILSLYSLSPAIQKMIISGTNAHRLLPIRELKQMTIPVMWSQQAKLLFR